MFVFHICKLRKMQFFLLPLLEITRQYSLTFRNKQIIADYYKKKFNEVIQIPAIVLLEK